MSEEETTPTEESTSPEVKVRRERRWSQVGATARLYEPLPEEPQQAAAQEADPQLAEEAAVSGALEGFAEQISVEELPAAGAAEALATQASPQSQTEEADRIVRRAVIMSASTALIPVPLLDMFAATVVDMQLVKNLSDLYEMTFNEHRAKALIAALLGGVQTGLAARSLLKFVPLVGYIGVVVPAAAISGGLTYALGKVFVQHFEMGGTLLDFDPAKVREYFADQYQAGQALAGSGEA